MGKKDRKSGGLGGLFGKKSKAETVVPEEQEQEQAPVQPARKGRVEEPLLHETVWETTVDCCRANPLFTVKRDDEDYFVGLYMPFSAIGGLSKKESRHNESKGSIVGQINHGKIAVMNTSSLIQKDAVVFLPTEDSLSNMAEFSLLADTARYELCFINADSGELELTGVKTDLVSMQALHLENKSVATVPGIKKLVDVSDEAPARAARQSSGSGPIAAPVAAPRAPQASYTPPAQEEPEEEYEPEEYGSEEGYTEPDVTSLEDEPDDGLYDGEAEAEPYDDEAARAAAKAEADAEFESGDEEEEELGIGPEYMPERTYTVEETRQAISRKFFNDEISEELTTAPLDQALADVIPFRPVQYRPGGWLDDQINVRVSTMNQEMAALHQEHLGQVRQRYLDTMVSYYMEAMRTVDNFEESEEYKAAKEAHDDQVENSSKQIAEKRKALADEFEQKVKAAGEEARVEAEQRYRERYHWQFDQRSNAIEGEVLANVQAKFEAFVSRCKNQLKAQQLAELDEKCQKLIGDCIEQYAKLAEDEAAMRKLHEESLQEFLEANRKDEVARITALQEEQAREDKVARIQKEYEGHVAQLKQQFDALGEAHESNLKALKERHADEMTAQENLHRRDIAVYASDNQRQQARIDQLTASVTQMDEKKSQEYAAKIAELEAQRDAGEAKYQDLVASQRKGNKLMIAIAAVTAILCLAIGVLAGQFIFSNLQAQKDLIDDLQSYVSQQGSMPSQDATVNGVQIEDDANANMPAEGPIDDAAASGITDNGAAE